MRVLVAIDGSGAANLAVDLVADVAWPAGTARGSGLTEVEVARKAAAMADAAPSDDDVEPSLAARRRDPGYSLISDGHSAFERALHVRVPLAGRLRRAYIRTATEAYHGRDLTESNQCGETSAAGMGIRSRPTRKEHRWKRRRSSRIGASS